MTKDESINYKQAWVRLKNQLQKKTSWGRVELEILMLDCLISPEEITTTIEKKEKL
jgi:hypothetical protein